jgi:hypothetical protein
VRCELNLYYLDACALGRVFTSPRGCITQFSTVVGRSADHTSCFIVPSHVLPFFVAPDCEGGERKWGGDDIRYYLATGTHRIGV